MSSVQRTTLKVDPETRDRLRAAKIGGETYDDVVNRLLDEVEGTQDGEHRDDGSVQ